MANNNAGKTRPNKLFDTASLNSDLADIVRTLPPLNPVAPTGAGIGTGFTNRLSTFFGGSSSFGLPPIITPIVPTGPTVGIGGGISTVTINNAVAITDTGIQQVASAVNAGITDAAKNTQQIVEDTEDGVKGVIQDTTNAITAGVNQAETNLGNEVTVTTQDITDQLNATTTAITGSIAKTTASIAATLAGIIAPVAAVVNNLTSTVQTINDTLIQPLANLYNGTIGTVVTLTNAIENDLKNGLSGILLIPGQITEELAGFDATLNRTVQQLGTVNAQTVTSSIDYLGQQFPTPFSAALSTALSGKTMANSLTTTFADKVPLSSESLIAVSQEAISGLSTLLGQLLKGVTDISTNTLSDMHSNWGAVGSMFTGLLDGALSLITTLTAIGALAGPLIAAAEQEANVLVPTTKLDPNTVIEALKRGFIDTSYALTELSTKGIDPTRSQVLIDMSVFLADANLALDWWYRGIIADDDLIQNLEAHGFKTEDITAYKEGSIILPALTDLLRWLNFNLITQDQFTANMQVLRYDAAQITAILSSYQEHETPQTLSALSGLLDNSGIGFLSNTLNTPVPDTVALAGQRAGYHPDLVRYIWLAHWQVPEVQTFIQAYFRGTRTRTELNARMAIANIPPELWDDLVTNSQALIPFRSIPTFVKSGLMTTEQAQGELAAHGFDLAHQQIIMASITPKVSTTNTTATSAIHTLSQSNARTLWSEGAITDDQYTQILEAHGYTADTAALQLKADAITEHIKAQKQELADLTSQVLAGSMTLDAANIKLNTDGFTSAQLSKFQANIAKQQKVNVKIPSIPELTKFLTAQLITLDQYTQALQQLGWQDPWLTAYLGLVSSNGVVAGMTPASTT